MAELSVFRSLLRLRCRIPQSTFLSRMFSSTETEKPSRNETYVPRRALLYVPASNEKMMGKVAQIQADCVVLECEDGVALASKALARENCVKFLNSFPSALACQELGLRVNSVSSGLMPDDFKALSAAETLPQALMVPKVDSLDDLKVLWNLFKDNIDSKTPIGGSKNPDDKLRLVIWIESARALIDMPTILQAAQNLEWSSRLKLDGAVFGSDDFCADIGATRSSEGTENLYARQKFVTCCKAFGLQAIDAVFIDVKNLDGLKSQCEIGRSWGFTGKQVIHPSQVPVVQDSFLPPAEKIQWAKELIEKFEEHQKLGTGAFTFQGHMIDKPLFTQAKNIVDFVSKVDKK